MWPSIVGEVVLGWILVGQKYIIHDVDVVEFLRPLFLIVFTASRPSGVLLKTGYAFDTHNA